MSRSTEALLIVCVAAQFCASAALAQGKFQGIGRPATPAEVRAWDIDVRADFTGLPKGSGTVAKGQEVWDAKCASCHGTFGESNEVFAPIVGGTRKEDAQIGRVAALKGGEAQRTTLMKLSSISTLWDYINRAMPWTAPKTLTTEEVYAVTAYILNLGEIVPGDFTLSNENIAEVQKMLPNRRGMTRDHGLWNVKGKPDVTGETCVKDCPVEGKVVSEIPAHARNAHGNLMAQHRAIGPVRGVDTTRPALAGKVGQSADEIRAAALAVTEEASGPARGAAVVDGSQLLQKHACAACHAAEQKTIGPSIKAIAARYKGRGDAEQVLLAKVKAGGAGVWGDVPMPAQAHVSEEDLKGMVRWMLDQN